MLGRIFLCFLIGAACVPGQDATPTQVPKTGEIKTSGTDGQPYVWIPPGKVMIGCSVGDNRCDPDESPSHEVEITSGFWLGQTPTTVGAWRRYRNAQHKEALPDKDNFGRLFNEGLGDDSHPAVAMTWTEAQEFCVWAGGRLPTEAEWEYAARATNRSQRYGYIDSIAWYADNSGTKPLESLKLWQADQRSYPQKLFDNGNGTHPVGQKSPNLWNLYDMLGNVWQWTQDGYSSFYYQDSPAKDPQGPETAAKKVVRGGAWYSIPTLTRVSARNSYIVESRNVFIGVRCVVK